MIRICVDLNQYQPITTATIKITGQVHQYQHHTVDLNHLASRGTGEVHLSFTHSFGEGNNGNVGVIQPTWLW